MIHWLFWLSLVVLLYASGCWLIATFWEPGARAVIALGDMIPTGESCELPAGMARVPQSSAASDDRIATQPVAHPSLAKVDIRSLRHDLQRYETVGDYVLLDDGTLAVRVSRMSDPRYEFLVALHELVEATLLRHRRIPFSSVDDFDIQFERNRAAGNLDEPGDDQRAPYHREHQFATFIERAMAAELGVDWGAYTAAVNALSQ